MRIERKLGVVILFLILALPVFAVTNTVFSDVNADGNLDFFLEFLVQNNGTAFINRTNTSTIPFYVNISRGYFVDFTKDGSEDLYIVLQNESNKLFEHVNNFVFNNVTTNFTNLTGTANSPVGVCFVDFNNDGDVDAFVNKELWLSNTTHFGIWNVTNRTNIDEIPRLRSVKCVDVNLDDNIDISGATENGSVVVFLNIGDYNGDGAPEFYDATLEMQLSSETNATFVEVGDIETGLLINTTLGYYPFNTSTPPFIIDAFQDFYIVKNGTNVLYTQLWPELAVPYSVLNSTVFYIPELINYSATGLNDTGQGSMAIIADFDNNSLNDILIANHDNTSKIMLRNGTSWYQIFLESNASLANITNMKFAAATDKNNSGAINLLVGIDTSFVFDVSQLTNLDCTAMVTGVKSGAGELPGSIELPNNLGGSILEKQNAEANTGRKLSSYSGSEVLVNIPAKKGDTDCSQNPTTLNWNSIQQPAEPPEPQPIVGGGGGGGGAGAQVRRGCEDAIEDCEGKIKVISGECGYRNMARNPDTGELISKDGFDPNNYITNTAQREFFSRYNIIDETSGERFNEILENYEINEGIQPPVFAEDEHGIYQYIGGESEAGQTRGIDQNAYLENIREGQPINNYLTAEKLFFKCVSITVTVLGYRAGDELEEKKVCEPCDRPEDYEELRDGPYPRICPGCGGILEDQEQPKVESKGEGQASEKGKQGTVFTTLQDEAQLDFETKEGEAEPEVTEPTGQAESTGEQAAPSQPECNCISDPTYGQCGPEKLQTSAGEILTMTRTLVEGAEIQKIINFYTNNPSYSVTDKNGNIVGYVGCKGCMSTCKEQTCECKSWIKSTKEHEGKILIEYNCETCSATEEVEEEEEEKSSKITGLAVQETTKKGILTKFFNKIFGENKITGAINVETRGGAIEPIKRGIENEIYRREKTLSEKGDFIGRDLVENKLNKARQTLEEIQNLENKINTLQTSLGEGGIEAAKNKKELEKELQETENKLNEIKKDELIESLPEEDYQIVDPEFEECKEKGDCVKQCIETPCQSAAVIADVLIPYEHKEEKWPCDDVTVKIEPPEAAPAAAPKPRVQGYCGDGVLQAGEQCEIGTRMPAPECKCISCQINCPDTPIKILNWYTWQLQTPETQKSTDPTQMLEAMTDAAIYETDEELVDIDAAADMLFAMNKYEAKIPETQTSTTLTASKSTAIEILDIEAEKEYTEKSPYASAITGQIVTPVELMIKDSKGKSAPVVEAVSTRLLAAKGFIEEQDQEEEFEEAAAEIPETESILENLGELYATSVVNLNKQKLAVLPKGTKIVYTFYKQDQDAQVKAINEKLQESNILVEQIFDVINKLFSLDFGKQTDDLGFGDKKSAKLADIHFDTANEARTKIYELAEKTSKDFYFGAGFFNDLDTLVDYSQDYKQLVEIQERLNKMSDYISSLEPLSASQLASLKKEYTEISAELEKIRASLPDIQKFAYNLQTEVALDGTQEARASEITTLQSYIPEVAEILAVPEKIVSASAVKLEQIGISDEIITEAPGLLKVKPAILDKYGSVIQRKAKEDDIIYLRDFAARKIKEEKERQEKKAQQKKLSKKAEDKAKKLAKQKEYTAKAKERAKTEAARAEDLAKTKEKVKEPEEKPEEKVDEEEPEAEEEEFEEAEEEEVEETDEEECFCDYDDKFGKCSEKILQKLAAELIKARETKVSEPLRETENTAADIEIIKPTTKTQPHYVKQKQGDLIGYIGCKRCKPTCEEIKCVCEHWEIEIGKYKGKESIEYVCQNCRKTEKEDTKAKKLFDKGLKLYKQNEYSSSAQLFAESNKQSPNAPATYLLSKSLYKLSYNGLAYKTLVLLTNLPDWEQAVEKYCDEKDKEKSAEEIIQYYSQELQEKIQTLEQTDKIIPIVYNILFDTNKCLNPKTIFAQKGERIIFEHILQKNGYEYYAVSRFEKNNTKIIQNVDELINILTEQKLCEPEEAEDEEDEEDEEAAEEPRQRFAYDDDIDDAEEEAANAVSDTMPETGVSTLNLDGTNFACVSKTKAIAKLTTTAVKDAFDSYGKLKMINAKPALIVSAGPKPKIKDSTIVKDLATEAIKPKLITIQDKICVPETQLAPEAQKMLDRPEQKTKIKEDAFTAKRVFRIYTITQDIAIPPFKIGERKEETEKEIVEQEKTTQESTREKRVTETAREVFEKEDIVEYKKESSGPTGAIAADTQSTIIDTVQDETNTIGTEKTIETENIKLKKETEKDDEIKEALFKKETDKTIEDEKETQESKAKLISEETEEEIIPEEKAEVKKTDVWDSSTGEITDDSIIENYVVLYIGKELELVKEQEYKLDEEDWEGLELSEEEEGAICTFDTSTQTLQIECKDQENCFITEENKIVCTETFELNCLGDTECKCKYGKTGEIYCNGYTLKDCKGEGTKLICSREMMPGCEFKEQGQNIECEGFDSCTIQEQKLNCTTEPSEEEEEDEIPETCTETEQGIYSCEGFLSNSCKLVNGRMKCDSRMQISDKCSIKEGELECEKDYNLPENCKYENGNLDCQNNLDCGFGEQGIECWPKQPDIDIYTPEDCILKDEELLCAEGIDKLNKFPPECTIVNEELECYEEIELPADCKLTKEGVECEREGQYCGFDTEGRVSCIKPEKTAQQGCVQTYGGLKCEGYEIGECGFIGREIICEKVSPKNIPEGCEIIEQKIFCDGARLYLPENCKLDDEQIKCDDKDCYYVNNMLICEAGE